MLLQPHDSLESSQLICAGSSPHQPWARYLKGDSIPTKIGKGRDRDEHSEKLDQVGDLGTKTETRWDVEMNRDNLLKYQKSPDISQHLNLAQKFPNVNIRSGKVEIILTFPKSLIFPNLSRLISISPGKSDRPFQLLRTFGLPDLDGLDRSGSF